MKVMVIVKASRGSEAGELPSEELLAAMGAYNEQLAKAGVMLDGAGLHPSSRGARVHFSGDKRTVTDGPFAETKELIAGFWMWQVDSLEHAVEWVKKCPNPMQEDSDIEIRQVFEADDFGEAFTPELREQEAAVMAPGVGLPMPRFEDRPAGRLVGLAGRFDGRSRHQIPALWDRFVPRLGTIPGQVGGDCYGVSWEGTAEGQFQYLAGVELAGDAPLPDDFTTVTIPAGRYAVFAHSGPVTQLPATIDAIWEKWVPKCGLKIAAGPCVERYLPDFRHDQNGGMEIWIPLEPA